MRKLLLFLAVCCCSATLAMAGPNEGGTLVLHDTGLVYTTDSASYPSPAPVGPCPGVFDAELPLEYSAAGWVWKAYAVFPPSASPRLKALAMSESFESSRQ